MKYTVLIAGGFKPPHKGHYNYLNFYLEHPDVEKVILFCGDKKRNGVSQEATEAMLRAFGTLDHPKMDYKRATQRIGKKKSFTNPLADCYDWADENSEISCGLGWSSKDKGYQVGFMKYFSGDDLVISPPMFNMIDNVSATAFREAILGGSSIKEFLPDHVNEENILKILEIEVS
jgi:phosphopantetheine adenylyltransferase